MNLKSVDVELFEADERQGHVDASREVLPHRRALMILIDILNVSHFTRKFTITSQAYT